MVSPSRRRDAVAYLVKRHPVSERRACQLVGQHRSTQRYESQPPGFELELVKRLNELAARHPRYGYRRIWALLRSEGFEVNHKRIERLWRLEGHKVPPRRKSNGQKAIGGSAGGTWAVQASGANDVWSWDFVAARTEDGQPLRILNIVDEYTRRCLACRVARNIGARDLIDELENVFPGTADRSGSALTTAASSSPRPWLTGSGPRRSGSCSSPKARRSRTPTSSGSTARCAMRCSTASCSAPCSRPRSFCTSGSLNTTPFARTAVSGSSHPSSSTRRIKWAVDESVCPHSLWTRRVQSSRAHPPLCATQVWDGYLPDK